MPSLLSTIAISTADQGVVVDVPLTVASYARYFPLLLHLTERTGRSGSVIVRTTDMLCTSQMDTDASLQPNASRGRPSCLALVMLVHGAQCAWNVATSSRSSCTQHSVLLPRTRDQFSNHNV